MNSNNSKQNIIFKIKNVIKCSFTKKNTDELISASKHSELKKSLNVFDLIVIGIGAVVGTGIFTIIGTAIQGSPDSAGAGPAIIISMLFAAIACVFSALCYSEIASMIPVAGSAYTYTYAAMGEFMAWMVGWLLMLEYAISNITVACAWTGYLVQCLKGFKHILPDFVVNFPMWLRNDFRYMYSYCDKYGLDPHTQMPFIFDRIPFAVNLPAIFIVFVLTILLIRGIKESTKFAGIMVCVNMLMIISFIVVGAFYVKPENWVPFAPNGLEGILSGAFIIFFAYIGFDAISTTAEEVENPQKDLPIAILGTLILCTVLYVLVALVLTGIVPLGQIDTQAPIAHAMRLIQKDWIAGFISVGALCALTSVLLIYQLGATRILFAMSRDKFLPKSLRLIHRKYRTPHVLTWIAGIVVMLCALFMDLSISAELCNFGVFTSFIIICIAVLILRKTDPDRKRPFKVPLCPWFPIFGIVICAGLMFYSMKSLTTSAIYFPIWLLIGFFIYAGYGYKQKRLEDRRKNFYSKKV